MDGRRGWNAATWLFVLVLCAPVLRCQAAEWQLAAVLPPDAAGRVILDPYTGDRWLLERDPAHPGGPGRLVRAGRGAAGQKQQAGTAARILRAGDRLIVVEDTPVVEARLEAVALAPAAIGQRIPARLAIGGRVVQVLVQGPGRAALAPEARP